MCFAATQINNTCKTNIHQTTQITNPKLLTLLITLIISVMIKMMDLLSW